MQGSPPALVPSRMDWDRPPWNRWAFHHMREILPTVEVWRGTGPVRVLPRADVDLDLLPVADSRGAPTTLAGLLDEAYCDAFLVLKRGAIVYERYFNGMDWRTPHLSQSVAKSIVGTLCGILVGQGFLDPAEPITAYLPELEATAWRGATLQHVLDMTTGVRFSEAYTDPYSDIGQVDVASGWKPVPEGSDPTFVWPQSVWEAVLRLKTAERPHGTMFLYRSIETDVLAFALERATGRRLAQLVSEELWQKLGAEENAFFTVDSAGYALAEGGFNATLRDYGRFGQLLLEHGGGVVPPAWIEATRTGFHDPHVSGSFEDGAYRNQFWIEDSRSRALMARGVFGQLIHIDWTTEMVVVKLSSYPDFLDDNYARATLKAVHAIAAALA